MIMPNFTFSPHFVLQLRQIALHRSRLNQLTSSHLFREFENGLTRFDCQIPITSEAVLASAAHRDGDAQERVLFH